MDNLVEAVLETLETALARIDVRANPYGNGARAGIRPCGAPRTSGRNDLAGELGSLLAQRAAEGA
jgi:hypothetical protein